MKGIGTTFGMTVARRLRIRVVTVKGGGSFEIYLFGDR